jgi:hypothetical protein
MLFVEFGESFVCEYADFVGFRVDAHIGFRDGIYVDV